MDIRKYYGLTGVGARDACAFKKHGWGCRTDQRMDKGILGVGYHVIHGNLAKQCFD